MSAALYPVAVMPWLALVGATLVAFTLCEEAGDAKIATTLILLIAAFKIHLVVAHFMEVGRAARPWRLVLEIWIGVVGAIVIGGYWLSIG